jgi:hypothetical protein
MSAPAGMPASQPFIAEQHLSCQILWIHDGPEYAVELWGGAAGSKRSLQLALFLADHSQAVEQPRVYDCVASPRWALPSGNTGTRLSGVGVMFSCTRATQSVALPAQSRRP